MEEVKIPISLEDGGFENGAKRILDRMEDTQREVKKTGMSVDYFAKHMQEVYRRFDKLTAAVHENTAAIGQDSRAAKQLGRDLDETTEKGVAGFGRLEKAAIGFFTVQKAKEFISTVYEVRSEIEKLETSLTTFVGNKAEADALIASIRKIPMSIKDLSGAAETMMGFGVATNEVAEDLEAIGNIARGDSQRFQSLSLAFSQASSTGKLMGQDFLQMVNAGFNPLDQIAKTTGKDMATLKKEMSEGAISAEMMRQAFIDATSEGGKFNGMLEAQSKTMAGSYNELQRAIDDMFNKIGENTEGIMKGAIDVATVLAKNYETVGNVLLQLVATYGSYKAAVMAVTAAEAALNGTYTIKIRLLRATAVAQQLLNKTMLANPYVAVATAVLSVASALAIFRNKTDDVSEAQKRLNETSDDTQAQIRSERKEIDSLFDSLRKAKEGTDEYKKVKDQILNQYGQYLKGLNNEVATLKDVEGAYKAVAKAARDAALARGKEAAIREADTSYRSNYTEYIGKIYDEVKKYAGETNAKNAIKAIQNDLEEIGEISEKTQRVINRVSKGNAKFSWFGKLNEGEKDFNEAKKRAEDMFQLDDEISNKKEENVTRNKEVIEEEKKNLQAQLENLSSAAAASKEGAELKKQIRQLDEELKAYNTKSDKSAANAAANAAKQDATMRQKLWDNERKEEEEIAAQRLAARNARRQAEIAQIKDDGERKRAEEEYQFQQDIDTIKRQAEEFKKKNLELAREQWEASNKDKKKVWADTDIAKAGWQGQSLTADQDTIIKAQTEQRIAERKRQLEEERKLERQYLYDYIKEYGSLQDQRAAITAEYDQKIADEGNTIQKAALQKQKEQLLAELDMKEIQQSINWEVVFNDLNKLSTSALKDLKKKLKAALDVKDITPENAKVLSEKILEIENRISDKTNVLASILPGLRERKRLTEQAAAAEELYQKALERESASINKVLSDKQQIKDLLDSVDIRDELGQKITVELEEISEENKERLLSSLDKDSDLYKKLLQLFENLAADATEQSNNHQSTEKSRSYAKELKNSLDKGNFKQLMGDLFNFEGMGFTEIASLVNRNVQSMAEFTDKIGLAGTDFGEAVHGFSEGVNGFMSAIQSLASGDVFGAVNGVIDGLAGFGKSLTAAFGINWSGGNAEEHDRKEEELIKANENLEVSINRLKESFDKANGMKAIETSQQIIKDMEQSNKNLMERWINDMGYHDAHHSNASNWEGFSNEQIRRMNEVLAAFGGHINGSDWEELTNLTPEALDAIREKLPDVWDFITSRGKYSWVYDSLNEYADQAGKIAEQEKALKENLTQLSESSLHDQFVSDLMDMEKSAEDFGNDFSEILMKAVLNAKIGNLLDDDLTAWRDELARRQEANGGTLTDADVEALRKMWDAIVEKGTEARDQLAAVTGYGKEAAEEAVLNIDSIRSAFADLISDTTQDVEEWAKNLTNTFINEFLQSQLLDDAFEERMNLWAKDFNDAWGKYQSGEWSEDVLNDFIYQLGREMDLEASQIREKAEKLKEALGYTFDEEQSESAFKDLRSSFLDTLLDMEGDAESFRKKLNETLVRDLIEKKVLDVPITINDTEFENFTAYAEDWNKRYKEAVKSGNQEAIDALMEELVQVRELTVEAAEALRDKLRETKQDTTFKDMADSWISALMDANKKSEDWAQDIGRTMAEKIIRELLVASAIQPMLDNLQNVWNEAFDDNGHDWQATLAAVKPLIDEMTEKFPELQKQAQGIMEAFGVSVEKTVEGFGDLRGTFVSDLMDMEKDAEQFGRDIARAMTEQMVSALIEQQFSEELAAINEAWFNALEAGDTAAMEKIRQQLIDLYSAIGDAVKPLLDSLAEIENVAEEEVDDTITKMRDDFLSTLMDMKARMQDFVNDIRKLLTKKLVDKFVLNSAFDSWLEGIQHQYDDIFNGDMSEEQAAAAMNRLAAEWEAKAKEMQEQTQAIFDLTGWTAIVEQMNSPLADLRSSFVSELMDMESDAEDFADNISKILTEAFIDRFVLGEEFDKRLSEWQEQYAAIMKGNYSEEERALLLKNLQAAITAAKEGYAEEAQAIHDLMGTGNAKDQTATMNMADKATYDQFETYLGIAVAQQMATLQGNEVRLQILATLQAMTGITSPNGDTVKEIRTMLNTTNEYLLDIKRSNRSILNQFGERLDTIISRLQGLI